MSRIVSRLARVVSQVPRLLQCRVDQTRIRLGLRLHPSIRRYLQFSRKLWKERPVADGGAEILVGLFHWYPSIHNYAFVTNFLARKHGGTIRWFHFFPGRDWLCEELFSSFGARPGLWLDGLQLDEARAAKITKAIFVGLKTKWDVVNITVDGVTIGDLIYDTYLRAGPASTVDVSDPRLEAILLEAVRLLLACRDYLARHRVVALIPDHLVYIHCGIIVRLAFLARIPIYLVNYGQDFHLLKIEGDPADCQIPMRWPYADYPRLFATLSATEQERAREQARQTLRVRLSGKADGILTLAQLVTGESAVQSAYAGGSDQALMEDNGRPRILVLLHDFCDAVHVFREMLFPDFFEWIHFLLAHASETAFDWYVKPHPNVARGGALAAANQHVLNDLKAQYPRIRFLEPTTSSAQIVREGVQAMFTVYGTGGHEFAYMGIPVVNAGDNPHIGYAFNLHPRTVAEYADCIANAATLQVQMRQADIEEYVYMNYFYFPQRARAGANPMPARYFSSEDYLKHYSRPETLDHLTEPFDDGERRRLDAYFDDFFRTRAAAEGGQSSENNQPISAGIDCEYTK